MAIGGMAEIFFARKDGLNGFYKYFVIKRLHPQYSADRQFVDMLIDEAKITARLVHPNIIAIHDLGELDGHFYLALEYVHGHDLFQVLKTLQKKRSLMPVSAAMFMTQELLSGLHYAHFRRDDDGQPMNIIHRDISPQNILVSYEGEVKLIDFGIVKAEKRLTETASGVIKGKFYYMSPEQASAKPIDHRSDIFSAGIVLYEALVAAPLYDDEEDSGKLLARVQRAEIAPPSTLRGDVPPDLERVVMKALNPDPERRFQTALAFHRALSECLASRELHFNRMDFALYLRKLVPPGPGRERSLEPAEASHLAARQASVEREVAPKPGVLPGSGLTKEAEGQPSRTDTQLSSLAARTPGEPTPEESIRTRALNEREETLRLALAAVVLAILLVLAAIAYVLRTTPNLVGEDQKTPLSHEIGDEKEEQKPSLIHEIGDKKRGKTTHV